MLLRSLIGLVLVCFCWGTEIAAAEGPRVKPAAPPVSLIDQALADLSSEDQSTQEAAVLFLSERGDPSLLLKLEAIRDSADRSVRLALKPLMDQLKNRINLSSPDVDQRRSAAADLGSAGKPGAIPWLEAALENEPHRWVRYAIEESIALLQLASTNPDDQITAATKLGELRSQNAVPALKELLQQGSDGSATAQHQAVASAESAAIEQIDIWASWAGAFETIFRGISLSSILLIMSLGLAIVFGL
ncbi:MAG: HEAT repeat domain-containing protein, partial [Nitrospira sp.]